MTELEGDSAGAVSIRPMTLRLVAAVGVDWDMFAEVEFGVNAYPRPESEVD